MEKSKKANECRNKLSVEEKVAKLPSREIVASQICPPSSEKAIVKQMNLLFRVKFE